MLGPGFRQATIKQLSNGLVHIPHPPLFTVQDCHHNWVLFFLGTPIWPSLRTGIGTHALGYDFLAVFLFYQGAVRKKNTCRGAPIGHVCGTLVSYVLQSKDSTSLSDSGQSKRLLTHPQPFPYCCVKGRGVHMKAQEVGAHAELTPAVSISRISKMEHSQSFTNVSCQMGKLPNNRVKQARAGRGSRLQDDNMWACLCLRVHVLSGPGWGGWGKL